MKKILAVGFLLFFTLACEQKKIFSRKKENTTKESNVFLNSEKALEDVKKILQNDCVSCHQIGIATGAELFSTNTPNKNEITIYKNLILERLKSEDSEKVMPPRNLRYKSDVEGGKKLIDLLSRL